MITVETLPVLVSALGLGLGLATALVRRGKDVAGEAQQRQVDVLKKLLADAEREAEQDRHKRRALEVENARLAAQVASLEVDRGKQ